MGGRNYFPPATGNRCLDFWRIGLGDAHCICPNLGSYVLKEDNIAFDGFGTWLASKFKFNIGIGICIWLQVTAKSTLFVENFLVTCRGLSILWP